MVTPERCELTELLVDACACTKHRGGQAPEEEAAAEQLAIRARLLATPGVWFRAKYTASACHRCGTGYDIGTAIRAEPTANGFTYIAECCAEEDL